MMRILGTIFAGLMGLCFGSFLNVCLSRWPAGESIVRPGSHCRQCGRSLAWWENLPLLSWLALRGRCRTCRAWIGWHYPLVEFSVGALWAIPAWHWVPGFLENDPTLIYLWYAVNLIAALIFSWLLVALAMFDAENFWLPNWFTIPGIILGLLFTVANAVVNFECFHDTVYASELKMMMDVAGQTALTCIGGILAAAGLILLIRWSYWLVRRREGVGLGDAKLMALLAAWLGLPQSLLAFAIGVTLGALAAIVMLVIPKARRESESWAASKLPLGTFLCIGGIVSSLWGKAILDAYLRFAMA
jgi:leader peptidase (prepilin peptidase)/N-methyltransferase